MTSTPVQDEILNAEPTTPAQADALTPPSPAEQLAKGHGALGALALAALGVVFGDIGTSPLYALQTVFSAEHNAVAPTREDVFGVISMVFWAITIVVSYGYASLMMRADNDGEGGILSLVALLRGQAVRTPAAGRGHLGDGDHRRGTVLRRQRDHPGDLADVGDRGSRRRGRELRHPRDAVVRARPDRSVLRPAVRDRAGGPLLRADHDPVVRHPRRAGRPARPGEPGDPRRDLPSSRARLRGREPGDRLHRRRRGRADRDRGGSALRRHGPFRSEADPARLVHPGVPGADRELHGPGCGDSARPDRRRQPVLPDGARVGTDPAGHPGHDGHHHRLAGGDLGCLLGVAAGRPGRAAAAPERQAHLQGRGRPDLRRVHQLDPVRGRGRPDHRLPEFRGAGQRLRTGRHRHPAAGDVDLPGPGRT